MKPTGYRQPDDVKAFAGFRQLKEVRSFGDFKCWFVNVYWYHYKWPTVAVVAALALIISTVSSYVTRVDPDYAILLATNYGYYIDGLEELRAELEEVIDDKDGDGKRSLEFNAFTMNETDEFGMANRMAMTAVLTRSDILLVIMDGQEVERFEMDGVFMPLAKLGLPDKSFVPARDCPRLDKLCLLEDAKAVVGIMKRDAADPANVDMAYKMLVWMMS